MYQIKHTFIHTVDQSEADRIRMLRRTQSESCNLGGGSTASTQCEISGDSGEDNLNGGIRGCLSPVSSSMGGSPRNLVEELSEQKATGDFGSASCEATPDDNRSEAPEPLSGAEGRNGLSNLAAELLAHACEGSMKLEPDSVDVVDRLEVAIAELESAVRQGNLLAHHLRAAKTSLQFATATLHGPGLSSSVAAEDDPPVETPLNVRSSYVQDLLSRLLLARKSSLDKRADTQSIDLDVNSAAVQTTVMLRDIPNNYSREMLLALLEREGFSKQMMNFLYYPIDFRLHAGLGYCFINFVSEADVHKFWSHFEGFSNWELPSRKIAHVSWALPLQGYDQCVGRYRNSQVMHHSVPDEFRPLLFKSGERIPFPAPTKTIRNPRYRRMRGSATIAA